MSKTVFLGLFVVCMAAAFTAGAEFQAGAAYRVITPDPLLPVSGGVGTPSPVSEKKGDLFARALVLSQDGVDVAIVSVDNLGIPHTLGDKARALVEGIPPENIIIGVTHTHSAPDAYGFPNERGETGADLEYLDWMCEMIAEAVNEAKANQKPADVKIVTEEIADGIAYNYYAEQLFDPRCSVLQAVGKDGAAICTLVNYAVHPEVIGDGKGILSPDLCGPFYERIESEGGGMALFMNSAQGGMVTADNRNPAGGEDMRVWDECVRIGNLLADEALRIVKDAPVQQNPSLFATARTVTFPVESEMLRAIVSMSPLMGMKPDNSVETTVNLVNVGTAQMITIPGEALPNIGAYLRRKMSTPNSFLFGLTNDAFGYILVKEDWGAFDRYNYISRTSLGERTGEIFVDSALDLIASCPAPSLPKAN